MSFEVCHSFYRASRLLPVRVEGIRIRCKFLIYNIVAWTVPLLIVGASVIVNYTAPALVGYGKTQTVCWISVVRSEIVLFLIPLFLVILLQLILISVSGYFLLSSKNRNNRDDERNTPYFRLLVAMVSGKQCHMDFWLHRCHRRYQLGLASFHDSE